MRMDHVAITVPDVDRSIEFYSKALGLKLLRVSVLHTGTEDEMKNAYMYSDHFLLELITVKSSAVPRNPPDTWQEIMRGSIGICHLGMRVRDLDAAIMKLKAAGARMIGEELKVEKGTSNIVYAAERVDPYIRYARRPGKKPWRIAIFSDPDGVIIELVQR